MSETYDRYFRAYLFLIQDFKNRDLLDRSLMVKGLISAGEWSRRKALRDDALEGLHIGLQVIQNVTTPVCGRYLRIYYQQKTV